MAVHESEQEQVEAIKKWWADYGNSIIAGLVIGAVALGGWRYWTDYQAGRAAAASVVYEQMIEEMEGGDSELALAHGRELMQEYAATPYGALGALGLARLAVEKEDYVEAQAQLDWAIEHAHQPGLAEVARLRLARLKLAQDQPDAALELVAQDAPAEFAAAYAEVRGDSQAAKGNPEAAREAYMEALSRPELEATRRALVQMKLDDL